MFWEHLKAWWRGDLAAITAVFDKAVKDVEDHTKYLTTIADNQAQAARRLVKRSEWLYQEADKARKVGAKLRDLIT